VGEGLSGIDEPDQVFETVREDHGGSHYADRTEYMPGWTSSELTDQDVAAITALPPGPDDEEEDED
jgi:hypothetical protein